MAYRASKLTDDLKGSTFDENTRVKFLALQTLMIKKHKDYGPKNILGVPTDPRMGIIIRLHDKLSRIANLIETGALPENESLVDSWMDIANYGVIGWMVEDSTFELPLEKD